MTSQEHKTTKTIMLPKKHRLARDRDFQRVYRKGSRLNTARLTINYLKNRNEATRLGFVVGKKINNKASRRNYLKRLLRVAFADLPKELNLSYDVIISLKVDPKERGVLELLMEEKKEVLRRISVY